MKSFYGVPVYFSSYDHFFESLNGDFVSVCTINAQYITEYHNSSVVRKCVDLSRNTIDGSVPLVVAKLFAGFDRDWEVVSGSHLIFKLAEYGARSKVGMFLLGADKYSNAEACRKLSDRYSVIVHGYSPPFELDLNDRSINSNILEFIKLSNARIVMVGLGVPKQDQWILNNVDALKGIGVEVVVGCGGAIDMAAEKYKLAPRWVRSMYLESVYRLFIEPSMKRILRIFCSFGFLKYLKCMI